MKCVMCGHKTTTRTERRRYDVGLDESIILPDARVDYCANCGEEYIGVKQIENLHRSIAMAVAQKQGPFTPREVRFLRSWLGLSSKDFAGAMEVTPETVSRWERIDKPQPMGPMAERLLRTMTMHGRPVERFPGDGQTKPLGLKVSFGKDGWTVVAA